MMCWIGNVMLCSWSAPEVIQQGPTTTAADVFSFAVTLWEIFEFGKSEFY